MKRSNGGIDLSLDYHAHVLPGCDHGSDRLETSLRQLDMAAAAGIRTVCATPHFYPHKESAESFLRRREECAQLLRAHLPEQAPQICLGAEVLICDGMERLEGLHRLCREGTNELLLEMPFYAWPESIWDTLYQLLDLQDIQIILAHAERYPAGGHRAAGARRRAAAAQCRVPDKAAAPQALSRVDRRRLRALSRQ